MSLDVGIYTVSELHKARTQGARDKRPRKHHQYDHTTGEGQKRMMYENRPNQASGVSYDPTWEKPVDVHAPGDHGADPLGDGKFKMVPSGDIVNFEERNKRLRKAQVKPFSRVRRGKVEFVQSHERAGQLKAGAKVTYTIRTGHGSYETDEGTLLHDFNPKIDKMPLVTTKGGTVMPAVHIGPGATESIASKFAKDPHSYGGLFKACCKHGVPGGDEFKTCTLCHPSSGGQVKPFVRTRKGHLEHVKGWTIEEKAARRAAAKEARIVKDDTGKVIGHRSASEPWKIIPAPADISHPDGGNWTDAKLKKWAKDSAKDMVGDFGAERVEEAASSMFFDMAQGILTGETGLRNYLKHKKGINSSQGRAEYLADELNEGYERTKPIKKAYVILTKAQVKPFTRTRRGKLEHVKGYATARKAPTQEQLNSDNWHTRTMARMQTLPIESLKFIVNDATLAAEAGEKMGNPKAGQYRDEAHYASMEIYQRNKWAPGSTSYPVEGQISSPPAFGADYKEKWTVIKQIIRDKISRGEIKGDPKSIQEERIRLSKQSLEELKQGPKPEAGELAMPKPYASGAVEAKWDGMSPSERVALLKKDPTMRHPAYANLIERMSNSKFSELTELQKDSIPFFKIAKPESYAKKQLAQFSFKADDKNPNVGSERVFTATLEEGNKVRLLVQGTSSAPWASSGLLTLSDVTVPFDVWEANKEELSRVSTTQEGKIAKPESYVGQHLSGTLFDINDVQSHVDAMKSGIKAPFVAVQYSALGGPAHVSIMISASLEAKKDWANGILHNSPYSMFYMDRGGNLEQHSRQYNMPKFRKTKVKSIPHAIDKINDYLWHGVQTLAFPSEAKIAKPERYVQAGKIKRTKEQIKAEKELRFALSEQDRYMGSVFVNSVGQRKHEDRVAQAYANYRHVGGTLDL